MESTGLLSKMTKLVKSSRSEGGEGTSEGKDAGGGKSAEKETKSSSKANLKSSDFVISNPTSTFDYVRLVYLRRYIVRGPFKY